MRAGETIHTENCYKFTLDGLEKLTAQSGWKIGNLWQSEGPNYALLMLDAV